MMGDEATKWFLRHHFRNHGLTVLRYFLKRGFMETLVKAYNICVTMVAQGHRHQLSIPQSFDCLFDCLYGGPVTDPLLSLFHNLSIK